MDSLQRRQLVPIAVPTARLGVLFFSTLTAKIQRSSNERWVATMSPQEEAHLRILKIISMEPDISQRKLATRLSISLGKTNFLVRALLQKGLIKVRNFRRAESRVNYLYVLTPKGIGARVRLTRAYLARKEAEYEALQVEVQALRQEVKRADSSHSHPSDLS